jgi:hypothetical protein
MFPEEAPQINETLQFYVKGKLFLFVFYHRPNGKHSKIYQNAFHNPADMYSSHDH